LLTIVEDNRKVYTLPKNLILTNKKSRIMKKLALILAVAFTMSLTASTVSAAVKEEVKKAKTEQKSEEKKDCAKSKECPSTAKKSCCGAAKTK